MARSTTVLLFLFLCSGAFCCNSGWYHYQGRCYKVSQNKYTSLLAKRYCQISQAHLAHITARDVLAFLNTVPNFNGANEYWVSEDSTLEATTTPQPSTPPTTQTQVVATHSTAFVEHAITESTQSSSLCRYVKILEIKTEYCSEEKFFICEVQYPNISDICPPGFDYYGSNCYRALSRPPTNFNDATKFCLLQNSKLAILDTEDKEWEAKAALIGKNETFLVAAKKADGVITWGNRKEFNPIHDLFANDPDGDCVGFLSDPAHPLKFFWAHVDCSAPNGFLCESAPLPPKEVETTTSAITSTAATLECPYGYNWKPHEESGYCYWETTYETERLNWFQARNFCKLYGGDLASYNNEEQESAGLGGARGHYRGLWIGLKRDDHNVFHWVDGNLLNFTNWDSDEPNLKSNTKFCVTHSSGSSQWELDYCGVRRWFVCKAPKVKSPVMPDLPSDKKIRCDIKDVSSYRTQWYKYQDDCYLIQDNAKYTWDTARLFCQDNGAHMVSIHSFDETNNILATITGYPEGNFWIGLSSHGLDSSLEWTDKSPLDFVYWSDTRSELKDFNTCVTLNKRDGSWDFDHCNRLQGVICKRGVNSSYDFEPAEPTAAMPGNCESGWYNLGNKCYKFFGSLWSQRLTWTFAKKECENLGASLVSVHSKDEQDFLTDIVLEGYTNVWIGLRAMEGGSIFHWSDDSRMDFTNWNANEPNGYLGDIDLVIGPSSIDLCVEMEYGETFTGKWSAIRCTEKRGYVCQKRKDPSVPGPYIDPFTCPNITGWSKLGSDCFGFFENTNMTWMEAQRECRKHSANLVTLKNAAVSVFVKRKLKLKNAQFWIGVMEKLTDSYVYVTGQSLFYSNWMVDQPQAASAFLDNCVAMTTDGEWLVKSCKERHPFICKTAKDSDPEPEIDRSHSCLNVSRDWKDFGGNYCYLIETDLKMTWVESMYYCYRHGGFLASFHSTEEIDRVRKNVLDHNRPPVLHIGLGRKKDGSFSWVDKSPLDFVNWDDNEPDQASKECVEMSLSNGKWNDINCNEHYLGFICSAPKPHLSDDLDKEKLTGPSEDNDVQHKLSAGGIFGIVLCVAVVLAIIGVTVYYLRPKKELIPKLLDQDNL